MRVSTTIGRFTTIGYIPKYYKPGSHITFAVMNAGNGDYVGMMQLDPNGDILLCPVIDINGINLLFSGSYCTYN